MPVLVPDGEALHTRVLRPRFRDIDNARIEIALFTCQPFVDRIGAEMGYTPPVVGRGEKLKPRELLLNEHIPEAEFDPQTPVGFEARLPRHQRLAVDDAPVAKARLHIDVTHLLDGGSLGQRTKKTGPLEIV